MSKLFISFFFITITTSAIADVQLYNLIPTEEIARQVAIDEQIPVAKEDGTPVITLKDSDRLKRAAHRYSYKITRKRINLERKQLDADVAKSYMIGCIKDYNANGLPIYDTECTRAAIEHESSRRERVGRDITNAVPTLFLLLKEVLK